MYHYKQCGLENVFLKNGFELKDGPYGKEFSVSDIASLHFSIGKEIAYKKTRLTKGEFKFLRKELDYSPKKLGFFLGKNEAAIKKYESGEIQIPLLSEKLLRFHYLVGNEYQTIEDASAGILENYKLTDREIELEAWHSNSLKNWKACESCPSGQNIV